MDLEAKLAEVEHSRPEALAAFREFEEDKRRKLEKITLRLSNKRRNEILAGWDTEERRLELFARWLASATSLNDCIDQAKKTGL
jgi:hypothetical protein